MAVCLAAHTLLRHETVFINSTGAVAVLFQVLPVAYGQRLWRWPTQCEWGRPPSAATDL